MVERDDLIAEKMMGGIIWLLVLPYSLADLTGLPWLSVVGALASFPWAVVMIFPAVLLTLAVGVLFICELAYRAA